VLGGVFISYRREDSGGFAGRIYDRLAERLGHESVFFDVDNIPPGLDFVDVLSERVGRCDALVAIIGRHWLTSADTDNRRRLDDPSDFVRIEIEAALGRGVGVIPVLVDGAGMSRAEDLPESLKKLARRQGVEISHTRFDSDVERLTKVLSSIEEEARRADPVDARTAARERESPPADAVPGEDLASKKEAPLDRNDSGASPAPGATGKQLTPLVLAAAAAAVLLALGALFVLRSRPPEPTSPSGDLARPSSPATLDPDASPSAPALAPPGSTANAAKSAIEVLGPPSKLLGGAPKAAAEAPTSNAAQDIDRLTREANAAVQGIRTDDAPANTKYANAAAPAPNGSARYRTTDWARSPIRRRGRSGTWVPTRTSPGRMRTTGFAGFQPAGSIGPCPAQTRCAPSSTSRPRPGPATTQADAPGLPMSTQSFPVSEEGHGSGRKGRRQTAMRRPST